MYCADMLSISLELAQFNQTYEDIASKFFEHFVTIAHSMNEGAAAPAAASGRPAAPPAARPQGGGLWDEEEGFFFDHLRTPDGYRRPVKIKSFVGLIPLFASVTIEDRVLRRLPGFSARMQWFLRHRRALIEPYYAAPAPSADGGAAGCHLLSLVTRAQLPRLLSRALCERQFLSPHGIRSLSKEHEATPFEFSHGGFRASLRYEPAESAAPMFGGNSNWRGPVWFPVNYLLVERLQVLDHFYGDSLRVELPTGSGRLATLWEVAADISERLISIFRRDGRGAGEAPPAAPAPPVQGGKEAPPPPPPAATPAGRAVHGAETAFFSTHPAFKDLIPFFEFFNGDTGAGLGARQQTGWTALVAKLIHQTAGNERSGGTPCPAAAAAAGGAVAPADGSGATIHSSAAARDSGASSASARSAAVEQPAVSAGILSPVSYHARLPGHLNLGPIDTGTTLDLPALLKARGNNGGR